MRFPLAISIINNQAIRDRMWLCIWFWICLSPSSHCKAALSCYLNYMYRYTSLNGSADYALKQVIEYGDKIMPIPLACYNWSIRNRHPPNLTDSLWPHRSRVRSNKWLCENPSALKCKQACRMILSCWDCIQMQSIRTPLMWHWSPRANKSGWLSRGLKWLRLLDWLRDLIVGWYLVILALMLSESNG